VRGLIVKKSNLFAALTLSAILLFSLSASAFAATNRYEAEKANLIGTPKATDSKIASGGKYIGDNNNVASDAVEFTVNVPADGTYQLLIGYGTKNDGAADTILANGTKVTDLSFPATNEWLFMETAVEGIAKQDVKLTAGDNKIRFVPNKGSVNLDYIDVVAPTAAAAAATTAATNPKTGDVGVLPYLALLVAASIGLFFFRKELNFKKK
jgi:hypothetical protein